jgi:hypothetical protein
MTENIIGRLYFPKEIYGNDEYSITVEITNLSDSALIITSIAPELIPGEILSIDEANTTSEVDDLNDLKRRLVKELEIQVAKGYENIYNKSKSLDIILFPFSLYSRIFRLLLLLPINNAGTKGIFILDDSKPAWASQALRVSEWSDVEKLEIEIISQLKDDSFLKKAFLINKEKLRNCLDKISQTENSTPKNMALDYEGTIQPKETVSFPYRCISPFVYGLKNYDIQFTVSYKNENLDVQGNYPIRDSTKVFASKSAIAFGAITGAILGFSVKNTLINTFVWFDKVFWSNLIGSITLAIIFGIATARSSESKKIITVENFAGGLLIGALCSLFSVKLISYLEKFIPQ